LLLRLLSAVTALLTSLTVTPSSHHDTARTQARPAAKKVVPAVAVAPRAVSAVPAPAVQGADVSWPNCPTTMGIPGRHGYNLPMPTRAARYVVLGATNGPAFTRNPCLAAQARWVKARGLPMAAYAVIHYPTRNELLRQGGRGTAVQRLNHVGAAEVRSALRTLRLAHVATPMVWVDVETVGGHPWSGQVWRNRAVLDGVLAELKRSGIRAGIYSYRNAWDRVMGGRRMLRVPTWVPSGGFHRADAMRKCQRRSFSGGRVVMTQWTTGGRDYNITCPGVGMAGLFRKA
jgi:hypothetical protein